jgi:hypothetical protein
MADRAGVGSRADDLSSRRLTEVVWERPPSPNETERWADFVAAYNEYIASKYFITESRLRNWYIKANYYLEYREIHRYLNL